MMTLRKVTCHVQKRPLRLAMSAGEKRVRDAAEAMPSAELSAAAIRSGLAKRAGADETPLTWRSTEAAAGVSGAEAYLCHLGRSINVSLDDVPVKAETARAQLRSVRAALHSAVDTRCDELEARINDAESTKIATLERELSAVDAVLERLRAQRGAAAEAAATLNDAELLGCHAELTARLDDAEAQLLVLSSCVIEPSHVGLVVDYSRLLARIANFGHVVAPKGVTARHLQLEALPIDVRAGGKLKLYLSLPGASHASQSSYELEVSLSAAAAATHVEATLEAPGAAPQLLDVKTSVFPQSYCIAISCLVPITASMRSSVSVASITVGGHPVAGTPDRIVVPVRRGVLTPIRLKWSRHFGIPMSLCITREGHIFIPLSGSPDVFVFDSNGAIFPGLPVAGFELSTETCLASFVDGASPVVLLAGDGAHNRIVAVDQNSRSVCWVTNPQLLTTSCTGLASIPKHGVAFAASADLRMVFTLRLLDGTCDGRLKVSGLHDDLTADPVSSDLYGTVTPALGIHAVVQLSWRPAVGLRIVGIVAEASGRSRKRSLAVVPPAPGKRVSHLVVGAHDTSELLVLALPGLALVHTHTLDGMRAYALAADPWGAALAVTDAASEAVHVLAWPLPGMSALE